MSDSIRLTQSVAAPVELALVLICEKCGKRAKYLDKNPSHQLASKIKRFAKQEFERGQIRAVLTSCMDLCPDERVAVTIVPARHGTAAIFLEASIEDIDATTQAVVTVIHRAVKKWRRADADVA